MNSDSGIRIPFDSTLAAQFPGPIEFVGALVAPIKPSAKLAINEDQGQGNHIPIDSMITFTFSRPTKVSAIEVVPHTNSITLFKVCPGDHYGFVDGECELHVKSSFGDRISERDGAGFNEYQPYRFNLKQARAFESIIIIPEKAFLPCGGWGMYRILPLDETGLPILPREF